jgi:hypothetical protein
MESVTRDTSARLITHNYVLVETTALLHSRLGVESVRAFADAVLPACEVSFVDHGLHERSMGAYLAGSGRRRSFVDHVSFQLMRRAAIDRAFTFDEDFAVEGFTSVPG